MFKNSAIALISFICLFASAADNPQDYQGRFDATNYSRLNKLKDSLTEAQTYNSEFLTSCRCRLPGLTAINPECAKRYLNLFGNKTLNFKLVFGYVDLSPQPYAMDPIYASALKDVLRRPCPGDAEAKGVYLCGFEENPEDNEIFVKQGVKGPNGEPHDVRFRIVNSSTTVLRADEPTEYQREQSEHAKETFYGDPSSHDGFCGTDVAMYLGHYREGCGPGFFIRLSMPRGPWTMPRNA